ncbi:phosphoenolpyruvate carboxykinase 2 [Artemisia annua]|uniref:phosphoenolpyruvate carboxykinase (ATP) n=1 Tax=Artemisia annua TaxID=35608 RepID=A0A2U1P0N3_ARTAN|nr:phosphoenolpyruvate carboxykinase 2 [Artemisia annua]
MISECTFLPDLIHTYVDQFGETNFLSPETVSADDVFRGFVADLEGGSDKFAVMTSVGRLHEAVEGRKRKKMKMTAVEQDGVGCGNSDGQQKVSHIAVERNRRKQMNEHLSVLRSLMPCFYVKRGDQASIIGGVVDYITELQQVLQSLEAKKQRKSYNELVMSPRLLASPRTLPISPQKSQFSPRPISLPISPRTPQPLSPYRPMPHLPFISPSLDYPSPSNSFTTSESGNELMANSRSTGAEVEVKFVGGNLLLKTCSNRIPGQATKVVAILENLSLEVIQANISVVDDTMFNSFTIKVGVACKLSADELAQHIQETFCTGKTTLSTDHNRYLIGDDEHCWSDKGVSNIEGGCYAKCIDLSREKEPDIWNAIKFGTVLENVVFDEHTREVDYLDKSVTENTRAAYPIEYIPNAKIPCVGPHPKNVILLACDAFGVLPPVSKLNLAQTMYHFISGYTALVAGTEEGVKEPRATFSACFGAAFIMLHPTKYAAMLATKMEKHGATGWLVNTGWSGGSYGSGSRMKLAYTRKIIDAIHSGQLLNANYKKTEVFGLEIPTEVEGVPSEILDPVNTWSDKNAYKETLLKLGGLFKSNFEVFLDHKIGKDGKLTEEILAAGPNF